MSNVEPQFRFRSPDRQVQLRQTTYGPFTTNNAQDGTFFSSGWYKLFPFTVEKTRSFTVPGIRLPQADEWNWGVLNAADVDLHTNRVVSGAHEVYPAWDVDVDTITLEAGDYVLYVWNYVGATGDHLSLTMGDILQALSLKPGQYLTLPGKDTLYDKFGKLWGVLTNNNLQLFGGLGLGRGAFASGTAALAQGRASASGAYSVAFNSSRAQGVHSFAHGLYGDARNQGSVAFGGYSQVGGSKPGYNQTQRIQFGGNSYSTQTNAQELLHVGINRTCSFETTMCMRIASTGKSKVVRCTAVLKVDASGNATVLNPQFTTLHADSGTDSWGYSIYGQSVGDNATSEIGLYYTAEANVNWGGEVKITELA